MLNRKILSIITAAGIVGFGVISGNAFAANATGNASANIVTPLSVVETTAMNFGSISPDSLVATTVVLNAVTGVAASADGAGVITGGSNAGVFTVTGSGTLAIAVTYSAGDTLTCDTPGCIFPAMAIGSFTDDAATNLVGGSEVFNVGATLSVGANQGVDTYSGTFTVTVNYN